MSKPSDALADSRARIRDAVLQDETEAVHRHVIATGLGRDDRLAIVAHAVELVIATRAASGAGIMQSFLVEYGTVHP